jgi:hypothetical protein
MASYPNYQTPQAPTPGYQPYGTQPTYYPGPSGPYAPTHPPSKEANESGYAAQRGDGREYQEYGLPMEIKKKRVNDVVFLIFFVLQVRKELFGLAVGNFSLFKLHILSSFLDSLR